MEETGVVDACEFFDDHIRVCVIKGKFLRVREKKSYNFTAAAYLLVRDIRKRW